MRVLVMIKGNEDSEAGQMPSEQLVSEMLSFNEELVKAGVMLAGEGLHPSARGARVRSGKDGQITVVDGPFTEAKELIAGFWMWQVKSMDEAIEWVRRMPNPDNNEGEIEIRPIFDMEDFVESYSPQVQEQGARLTELGVSQQQ